MGGQMKNDQNELERHLWTDRELIYTKYNDKLKVAQTKFVFLYPFIVPYGLMWRSLGRN